MGREGAKWLFAIIDIISVLTDRPFAKILCRHCFDFWCGVKFALGRMSDAPGANQLLLRCSSGVDVYQLPHRALQKMIFTPAVSVNHFGKGSSRNTQVYRRVLQKCLKDEGSEGVTNYRAALRLIPSFKAKAFKRGFAKVGYGRIEEIEAPELAAKRISKRENFKELLESQKAKNAHYQHRHACEPSP